MVCYSFRRSMARGFSFLLAGLGASCVVGCSFDAAGLAGDRALDAEAPFDAATLDSKELDVGEPDLGFDAGSVDSAVATETSIDAADAGVACDPVSELPFGGHCYSVVTTPHGFLDARKACAATAGAHLVTINAYEEDTFVSSITIGLEAWMGLTRDPPSNPKLRASFKWITGEPMIVDAWRGSEPDGTGECARHTATGWADAGCTETYAAICERE